MRIVVDLPAPLLPRKPKISPFPTSNDTSSTATNAPNLRVRCRTSMAMDTCRDSLILSLIPTRPASLVPVALPLLPHRAIEPRLGEPGVRPRARAIELGLEDGDVRVDARRCSWRRPRGNAPPRRGGLPWHCGRRRWRRRSPRGSESSSSRRCRTSNAAWRSKSARARLDRAGCGGRLGLFRAAPSAIPEKPAHVDRDVPGVVPVRVRGKIRGFGRA